MKSSLTLLAAWCFVAIISLWSGTGSSASCSDPCECGSIGFTEASKNFSNVRITTGDGKYTYWVHPCFPAACDGSNATSKAAGCQAILGRDPVTFTTLGRVDTVEWNITNDESFTVTYGNGDPEGGGTNLIRRVSITFIAIKNVTFPALFFVGNTQDDQYDTYLFTVFLTKEEADQGSSKAGSPVGIAGLVIMLLLLLGVVAYFVIGAVVMYKVKGARGVEVIPHYEFWKSLPFLIKDGFMFTISPCRKKFGSGYEAL